MKLNKNVNFTYGLSEAVSAGGVQFALLDKDGNIRHKPIRCKDYVQDVYWSELLKKGKITQYGFQWDGDNKSPISKQDRVKVAIMADGSNTLQPDVNNIKTLLNVFEKQMGISFCEIEFPEGNNTDIILTYDNKWSKVPCFVSLLFLLLRIGRFYKGDNTVESVISWFNAVQDDKSVSYNDKSMLLGITKSGKIKAILEGFLPPQKWEDYTTVSGVHNSSGIVGYSFTGSKKGAVLC